MAAAIKNEPKTEGPGHAGAAGGIPHHLPPIQRPEKKKNPYSKSRLMNFRNARYQQELLTKIIHDNAMKVFEETAEYTSNKQEADGEPEYPKEMMGKERRIRLNYQFLKKCVESAPITSLQDQWCDNILGLIPPALRRAHLKPVIQELFTEVEKDFESSMKKSMVQLALVKPEVKGLEDDTTGEPPEEPTGLDYSSPWHDSYLTSKDEIKQNLHILHPALQTLLAMCHNTLGSMLLVDCSGYRERGPLEFEHLRNDVILECEKTEEKLMNVWYPSIINVFADKNNLKGVKTEKIDSFYQSVTTLLSNQLKNLLVRTCEAWVNLFDEGNKEHLPILKMELIFDEQKMQFYPLYEDLEELVLFLIEQITSTLQQVQTIQSWLSGTQAVVNIDAQVADHIVHAAQTKLKDAVSRNFEEPKAHLQWFMDQYSYIVNGQARQEIDEYMSQDHTFLEYCDYIDKFRELSREIMGLPSIEHYDMIRLDCEDLKRGLADASKGLADVLLDRMATDHRLENKSICDEFNLIKERALKEPETSEELMEMVSFVENARTMGMIKLKERIKESHDRMQFLLDVYMFSDDDLDLNSEVLLWPRNIDPVFESNDELIERSKQAGEKTLVEKKEKLMLELQKLKQRVDEFNDYGEMDMMAQYQVDVRTVQKRLADAQEMIIWVNEEEVLYKYPVSKYPEVDEIQTAIDPFRRLFQVVFKWQKAEKKWMDGSFLDLDAEAIEVEVDEYYRDMYKIQKVFNQKLKKKKVPTATLR